LTSFDFLCLAIVLVSGPVVGYWAFCRGYDRGFGEGYALYDERIDVARTDPEHLQ
jgi:hypothetical protein